MRRINLNAGWQLEDGASRARYCDLTLPCQVHDVLLDRGIIENPNIRGQNQDRWIAERSWIYRKTFFIEEEPGDCSLVFEGIDTYAEILLNGKRAGYNKSAYMPLRLTGVPVRQGENLLEVRIEPPGKVLEQIELPQWYEGRVMDSCKGRVFRSGFSDFCGPNPDLIRMGIYGNVILEQVGEAGLQSVSVESQVNSRLDEGTVTLALEYSAQGTAKKAHGQSACVEVRLYDPDGCLAASRTVAGFPGTVELTVEQPRLWYPRTHGEQPLYRVSAELYVDGTLQDRWERRTGFRRIEQKGTLNFFVNHLPVKLYGANLAHADTVTGCYPRVKEKLYGLLDLAELGHFNCLRIWGESEILDDDFYEECDRRGLLLWQDFYLGWGLYSEEPEIKELCRQEAELLVKRLKHHPSILLWCGGNELFWSRDMMYPGSYCAGEPLVLEVLPEVCRRLDAQRYYHISSPSGGRFSNDPSEGDTHGYTHVWFVPGREYPVFLSENCRVSAPALRTMKRMMSEEELWPADYCNVSTRRNPLFWPSTWSAHNSNSGEVKLGPVEHYFEAENAEELIYRLGAAHSEYIKEQVERFRRGRPIWDAAGKRRTKGHLLWKFNNNSNHIFYGVVDYFNEPEMAYYALKRAYEPFALSFSVEDSIGVWAVNDTPRRITGKVKVSLMELASAEILREKEYHFSCDPDESILLGTLDSFGQFTKNAVLIAEGFGEEGERISVNTAYTEVERRLRFAAEGKLEARMEGDTLILNTDTFCRSVELLGNEDGDEFGWIFEDNYFDLIPGIEKRVRVFGRHRRGTVSVKPYYWEQGVEIPVRMQ